MTTVKTFRNAQNKDVKLHISETTINGKFVCYMRREDTNKSVQASGTSKAVAFNAALSKIKY